MIKTDQDQNPTLIRGSSFWWRLNFFSLSSLRAHERLTNLASSCWYSSHSMSFTISRSIFCDSKDTVRFWSIKNNRVCVLVWIQEYARARPHRTLDHPVKVQDHGTIFLYFSLNFLIKKIRFSRENWMWIFSTENKERIFCCITGKYASEKHKY